MVGLYLAAAIAAGKIPERMPATIREVIDYARAKDVAVISTGSLDLKISVATSLFYVQWINGECERRHRPPIDHGRHDKREHSRCRP